MVRRTVVGRGAWLSAAWGSLALLLCLHPGYAGAEYRNRGLERIVEGRYSRDEEAQIVRAFRSAEQAGVDESQALALVASCVEGEFGARETLRVLSLTTQLALEDLPIQSFQDKIDEGVAKRIPATRVLQVAERRALLLNQAKSVLNGLVLDGFAVEDREDLIPDLAEALEGGRSSQELRSIVAAALAEGEDVGGIRRKLFP